MYYSTTVSSPLGLLTLASDGENLAGLWLAGQKYFGGGILAAMTEQHDLPVFVAAKSWLGRYFAGEKPAGSEVPLRPVGSAFRQSVWAVLCGIPYGQVATYGGVAKQVAAQMGREAVPARAVGGAVGHNPISIIIPCHRVVGANGSLTGYAGGLAAKRKLLQLEGASMSGLRLPAGGGALERAH